KNKIPKYLMFGDISLVGENSNFVSHESHDDSEPALIIRDCNKVLHINEETGEEPIFLNKINY
ncbi:MAG: hypothetical protein WCO84_09250, partial [bacterium]